ncbi:Flavin monooxygenase-like protein [Metarhizium album ARSEF 1941]|uniref:Flavin monooxygenase-like protein n=1 Tax=Metarhizium album (strain ARSEF 1941) TaxID=1081103 RepID=A0A0B2WDC8_METAS|nr:Flavin monooxygenase-like protein [Metarhizium album ARSEF 1941]KHN93841.1 Flavin monooxygenase-like protein [Metarhizium album ARSEF 1941]
MAHRQQHVDYDVVIVGAGISGINMAYRLQERNPELSYCIIDGRHEIGGTWSLFKYPGIRSDSDLYTFGFPWRIWEEKQPIAHGSLILKYLKESAAQAGIDRHIKFNHWIRKMNWSSASSSWELDVDANVDGDAAAAAAKVKLRSRFVFLGTGYYDYNEPLQTQIPGIDSFKGTVVHPQFWPADLDYAGKNVVVIGSGATAVTLLPSMCDKAAHITMLQRSPSYIIALPEKDPVDRAVRFLMPRPVARSVIRFKWILSAFLLTTFCKWFPRLARALILRRTSAELPRGVNLDPHFTPRYNPWEQRMCLCPGGDFFKCLKTGKASVETGVIDRVTADTIKLTSGRELHPDIIVTATGLKVRLAGGIAASIDGKPVDILDRHAWKGCMLEDIPNLALSFGYVDASWTLGADATAQLVCRMLAKSTAQGYSVIVPRLSDDEKASMTYLPFMRLNSTYIQKANGMFPKVGTSPQWRPRTHYWKDIASAWWGSIDSGIQWLK